MARKLEVQIVGNSRSFERALGRAGSQTGKFGHALTRVGRIAALGLAGGLALSVKSAIDFESSFAGVRKTVDGTEAQLARLSDGIRDMAKEIPTSVNALNEIAESAGQLGVRREAILGFTRVIADLGETTNLVGEEAASSLARLANITQMPQKNFDRLGATIVALGNAGASTEKEIVDMALRIAGAGKQIGLTEPKILAIANALASVGIEAESGGSAISRVMIDIEKSVRKGGDALEGFAKVSGMSSADFKKAWEKDAAAALVTFIEGLGKLGEEGGNVFKVLDDLGLGNIRVRDTLLRAAGAGDLLRESLALGNKAWKENTALTEEAAKRYETTASQLNILKNNLIDVGIAIGEHLLPFLSRGARALTGLLEKVREADGAKAKITVAFAGVKGAVDDLVDSVRDALFGSVKRKPLKLDSGKIIEWETTKQVGLVKSIQEGLRGVDWTEVGQQVGEGISKRVEITADFIGKVLTAANQFIDAHADEFAELGAKMLLKIIDKLLDPSFWIKNWQLVLGIAVAVFPIGRVVGLGAKFAGAFLRPIAKLLPAGFHGIGNRAVTAILTVLGRLPGRVQSIIVAVVSRSIAALGKLTSWLQGTFRAVLAKVPGWVKAAFRLGALGAFLSFIQRIIDAVRDLIGWIQKIPSIGNKTPGGAGNKAPTGFPRGQTGGDISQTGMAFVHKGERLLPARIVNRGLPGVGGTGGEVRVIVVGGDPQAISYLRQLDQRERRRTGGRGVLG